MSRNGILREYYLQKRYGGGDPKFFKFITKIDGKEFNEEDFKREILVPFQIQLEQEKITRDLMNKTALEFEKQKYDFKLNRSYTQHKKEVEEARKRLAQQEKQHTEFARQLEFKHKEELASNIKFRNNEIKNLISQQRPFALYNSNFPHKKYFISDSERLEKAIVSLGGVLPDDRDTGFWAKKGKRVIVDKLGKELLTVQYKKSNDRTTAPIYALNDKRYDEYKNIMDNEKRSFFKNLDAAKGMKKGGNDRTTIDKILQAKARKFETLLAKSKRVDLMDTL